MSTIALTSTINPAEINTREGLAGTLIERICLQYNEDANQNGAPAIDRKKNAMRLPKKN
jgi:hypothetical protein